MTDTNTAPKTGILALVGKRMTKTYKFLGADVKISKLTVAEVKAIQEAAQALKEDENAGLDILRLVIRSAVEGAEHLTDDDFVGFPMDELSKLSNAIMEYSGIGQDAGNDA